MRSLLRATTPLASVAAFVLAAACSSSPATPANGSPAAATASDMPASVTPPKPEEPLESTPTPYDALPEASRGLLDQPFTGDADEMVKRRLIRVGVVFNRTHYFIDKGVQRGIAYESIKSFEDEINKRLKTGLLAVHVVPVPLQRDQLFPALQAGKVDMVAASLTITPERRKIAEFSIPTRTKVDEVPVTAKGAPPIKSVDELAGREVYIRRSSSFYESVQALNESLAKKGLKPLGVREAPEAFEDDDLLEMVNAGLVDLTIVDNYQVEFWSKIFPNVEEHPAAAVRTGGELAVGVRKNNPKLLQAANTWIKAYGARTAFGNILERKYLENTKYVKNAAADAERQKLQSLAKLFQQYGKQYNVDYLLMAAQGYQESGLDQNVRSQVGAIGVMQVMPATGGDLKVGDITELQPNIHAGVKYFRFMVDTFYKNEPMDELNKGLMTLASYNCGPGRMRQLRKETASRGLNPNVWFGNVERITSERVGRETVQYVGNIYKYYVAYKLVSEQMEAREKAKESVKGATK